MRGVIGILLVAAGCAPSADAVVVAADFTIAAGREVHPCVVVESPFTEGEQVVGWRPRVTSPAVHHWLLYRTAAPIALGVDEECRSLPPDAQLLFAWSPGGDAVEMPQGVGFEMSRAPGERLVLALHYLNSTPETVRDRSGVELELAAAPREDVAGVFVLGTSVLEIPAHVAGHEIASSCEHRGDTPIDVVAASPHMHRLGRALRTEVEHAGARSTLLAVDDFDVDAQVTHPVAPAIRIEPGDRLHTTCVYDNPGDEAVRYGIDLDDEMCLDYLIAHPVSALPRDRNCI